MNGDGTRVPHTADEERALARQGAVAALTALGRLRGTTAEAGSGAGETAPDSGERGGFSAPARAVRRPLRGSWRTRL